jgi:hypothetical protein
VTPSYQIVLRAASAALFVSINSFINNPNGGFIMFDMLLLVGIGMVIGWHVPMPPWAKFGINWVRAKLGMGPMGQ